MHKACHIATRILTTWPNTGPTNVSKSKKPTHQFTNYLGTKVKTCLNAAVKAKTVLRQYLSHGEVICRDHPKMNVLLNGLFTSWPNLCAVFPWKPGKLNFGASAVRPEHSLDFVSLRATKCFCMIHENENERGKSGETGICRWMSNSKWWDGHQILCRPNSLSGTKVMFRLNLNISTCSKTKAAAVDAFWRTLSGFCH